MKETDLPSNPPRLLVDSHVARITLMRPAHRNRLHREDLEVLRDHLDLVDKDPSVRVLVLDAYVLPTKPVFCSGFHIGDFEAEEPAVSLEDVMVLLERLRPVTICALNGSIYGGASDFPLACDMALGAAGVQLRMPTASIGLHYHPSGLERFVASIGVRATRLAFLTAEPIPAETLLRVGYVQELWPTDQLTDRVDALASHIAALSPLALETLKQSLSELGRGAGDRDAMQSRMDKLKDSQDFEEGRRAFSERRPPIWKGC